jgi:integrase/recombinase XerD
MKKSNGKIKQETEIFTNHITSRKYSPRSIKTYTDTLGYFTDYLVDQNVASLLDVDKKMILKYISYHKSKGLRDNSIELYFRVIKLLYNLLEEEQRIFINPTTGINYKVKRPLQPVPSSETIIKLINSVDISTPLGVRNRTMLEVLYGTGIRREELVRMNVTDISKTELTIRIYGKGSKERIVPAGRSLMKWLNRYMNDARPMLLHEVETNALWVTRGGGRLRYDAVQYILRQCKSHAGIDEKLTIHDFRRAFATHMLQNGASPVNIQAILGHSSLKYLSCYLRLTINDLRKIHGESRVGQ